jgi:hypothetical protein
VLRVRAQLLPISDVDLLEASFEREASERLRASRRSHEQWTAVRTAYAMRWRELVGDAADGAVTIGARPRVEPSA